MPEIDEEDARDHDRGRGRLGEKSHHRELRSAGEYQKAHGGDLNWLEPRLPGYDAEGRSDDEGRPEDRPTLGQRAARRVAILTRETDQTGSASNSASRCPRSSFCPTPTLLRDH